MKVRSVRVRVAAAVAAAVAVLGACTPDGGQDSAVASSTPTPALVKQVGEPLDAALEVAREAGFTPSSHDAGDQDRTQFLKSDWTVCFEKRTATTVDFGVVRAKEPCPGEDGGPIPWPELPDLVGLTIDEAVSKLGANDIDSGMLETTSPFKDVTVPADTDDWTICFTDPKAGAVIKPDTGNIEAEAVKPGTSCPKKSGGYLDKTNDPDYTPKPKPEKTSDSSSTGGSSSGGSSSGGSTSSTGGGSSGGSSGAIGGGCAPHTVGVCAPERAPDAAAMAECKDGTISYSQNFRGTCSHHGGVRYWFK